MTFVGLDIESSRGDLYARCIQLGIAYSLTSYSSTLVRWSAHDLEHHGHWQAEAEAVHKIPKEFVLLQDHNDEYAAHNLDRRLESVFRDAYQFEEKQLIAVGFNVGGFDLPILRRDMPRMAKYFHYRTLDLNSVMFMDAKRQHRDFKMLKDLVIEEAKRRLEIAGTAEARHNAGYDAVLALVCMQVLEEWR